MYNAWTAYNATAVPTHWASWARRPAAEHLLEYKSMAISFAAERALPPGSRRPGHHRRSGG